MTHFQALQDISSQSKKWLAERTVRSNTQKTAFSGSELATRAALNGAAEIISASMPSGRHEWVGQFNSFMASISSKQKLNAWLDFAGWMLDRDREAEIPVDLGNGERIWYHPSGLALIAQSARQHEPIRHMAQLCRSRNIGALWTAAVVANAAPGFDEPIRQALRAAANVGWGDGSQALYNAINARALLVEVHQPWSRSEAVEAVWHTEAGLYGNKLLEFLKRA